MHRLCFLLTLLTSTAAVADSLPANVRAHAERRSGEISIDGKLDEATWATATRQGGFIQRFPKDGARASHDTQFAFLYDDRAIYIGVWADDPEPELIRGLLTRRDVDALSDAIVIGIDSYHDRRTAYVFQLNAAGVQRDMMVFDDVAQDETWDAVWTGEVAITKTGWTAEFRIPLNQLRFAGGDAQEWGLQVLRVVARSQEQSTWSPWPRTSGKIVSRFGVVDGIDRLKPARRLELLPYATAGLALEPIEAGDPLNAHSSALGNAGLDLKYGLGPAFTLSATVNPDFGQVEADPSQVNLSANELFFSEKRPFFIEGVDLFRLPIGSGDNMIEGAFYSRRIGAAPDAPDIDYDYIKAPTSTTIYSAAKLTGKTKDGWSIGMLDAVTGQESATIVDGAGTQMEPGSPERSVIVAPLSNYGVFRVKRDLHEGKTIFGASATTVDRALDNPALAAVLHDHAYTGGLQLQHRWAENAWELDVHGIGSYVHGSEAAIANTQQLNRHLFQRPDAGHVHLDPMRTSLGGGGVSWSVGRSGETKHVRWATGGDLRTPGLELNDAGFQMYSDRLENWLWTEYREDLPTDDVLNWRANTVLFQQSTLEPQLLVYGFNVDISTQLANYWSFSAGTNVQAGGWDPIEMRGGPALRVDPRVNGRLNMSSDSRKAVKVNLGIFANRNWRADSMQTGVEAGVTIQARSNIDITVGPSWFERTDPLQYIDTIPDSAGTPHYLFGRIRQTTASLTARVNWTFSPRLSLQGYAQPFIAAGSYSEYKDVDNPHAERFEDRFTPLDGTEFEFDRPDFDFGQLRSTMVLRWEYRPGSALFAIWSHGQTNDSDSRFDLGSDLANLARGASENIVMVKANYWIGL